MRGWNDDMGQEPECEPDDYQDRDEEHYDPEDDVEHTHGWCSDCGKECSSTQIDEGIGPYEFWGARGVHHDWVTVSDCCEAEILESNPTGEEE
jgi:hypothetical protein